MKAGTLLFVIMIVFIAFGFMFSQYLNAEKKTLELEAQIAEMTRLVGETRTDLNSCQDRVQSDAQVISSLRAEIHQYQFEASEMATQFQKIKTENIVLHFRETIVDFLKANPLLIMGALVVQFVAPVFRHLKTVRLKLPSTVGRKNDEYVLLNSSERAWIIHRRRLAQSGKRDL